MDNLAKLKELSEKLGGKSHHEKLVMHKYKNRKPKPASPLANVLEPASSSKTKTRPNDIFVPDSKEPIYIKTLQEQHIINVQRIKDDSIDVDYIRVALIEAEQIWLNVQILMKSDLYEKMDDNKRIDLIQRDFKEFYKNFPIVSRYMICLGQYSSNAFKKMLTKYNEEGLARNDRRSDKDENERLWISNQADYVRFLFEDFNNNYSKKESDTVWQHTYDMLTTEFKEFKNMHDETEQQLKKDAIKYKKELLYEMSDRIVSGAQSLDDEAAQSLLTKLQDKLFKQRFKKTMIQLLTKVKVIDDGVEGVGLNECAKTIHDEDLQQSEYKKKYRKIDINKLIV